MVLQKQAHRVLESLMLREKVWPVCIGFCWPLPLVQERRTAEPAGSRVAPAGGEEDKANIQSPKGALAVLV